MRRLLALGLAAALLVGCGSDQDAYCSAVEDHQEELTELIGSTEQDALLQALEIFRELEERAPSDIADEWRTLVGAISGLGDAIEAAGADPDTYDPENPPDDVSAEEQKAIRAASRRLTAPETVQALLDLDQQARDVCHTPLSL